MKDKNIYLVKNAEVYPFHGTMDAFQGGIFDGGEVIKSSMLYRTSVPERVEIQEKVSGIYIFGGYLFGHFGHFTLESLSRAYAFKACANVPIIFSTPNDIIYSWQKFILKFLKINNQIIIIRKPVIIENLLMSDCGCTIHPQYISDKQIKALETLVPFSGNYPSKIWLSRSKISGDCVDEENEIERVIEKSGWKIIHPQELTIKEQTMLICSAKIVAGFDGSAFYTALFAKKIRGRFIIFSRRNSEVRMLSHILTQKNIPFETHIFHVERVAHEDTRSRFSMPDYKQVIKTLLSA